MPTGNGERADAPMTFKWGLNTNNMILINKDYAKNVAVLDTGNTEAADDESDSCDMEVEKTLVMTLCRLCLRRAKGSSKSERYQERREGNQHHHHAHPTSHRQRPYATMSSDLRLWGLQHGEVYPLRPDAWSQAAQLRTHARSKTTG